MVRPGRALLVASILWCAAQLATSLPIYWYDSVNEGLEVELPGVNQCDAQPTKEVTEVTLFTSPHGSPTTDSSISFAFSDAATGAPVTKLCAGRSHKVKVSFSSKRLGLLTASLPDITFTSPAPPTSNCPNRVDLGSSSGGRAATSFSSTFSVPCSAAGKSVQFKVTSADVGRYTLPWYQNSASVSVASDCGTCTPPGGTPAPSSGSPVPASSPSPPPTSRPPPPVPSPPPPGRPADCAPSNLGYQCKFTKGRITLHWSVNTSSAPDNACTPSTRRVVNSTMLAKYGSLHVAVEADVTGYVGIGFGRGLDRMYPADIVWGYATSKTGYIQSFFSSRSGLNESDRYPSPGSSAWAYDRAVTESSSGKTTICFSRYLADNRTRVSQNLRTDGKATALIWAVSNSDAFRGHAKPNRGSFYLNLALAAGVKVPSPKPPPSRKSPPPQRRPPPPQRRSPPPQRRSPPPQRRSPPLKHH